MPIEPRRNIDLPKLGGISELRKAQHRQFDASPIIPTGHYVKVGDTLKMHYASDNPTLPECKLRIGALDPFQNTQVINVTPATNSYSIEQDGILYIDFIGDSKDQYQYLIQLLDGGRPMPHFVLDRHNQEDWKEMLETYSEAPYAELVGDRTLIDVHFKYAKEYVDDAVALLKTHDNIIRVGEEQYGIGSHNEWPHYSLPQRYHHIEDDKLGGGGYTTQYRSLYYSGELKHLLQAEAKDEAAWILCHELGHHHQLRTLLWFPHTGEYENQVIEATANLSYMYVQREFKKNDAGLNNIWLDAVEYVKPGNGDFTQQHYEIKACMFSQFNLAFGKDFYAKLAKHYRDNIEIDVPYPENPEVEAKLQQIFMLESSRISEYNMVPFFEQWGIWPTEETKAAISELNLKELQDGCLENETKAVWLKRDEYQGLLSDSSFFKTRGERICRTFQPQEADNSQLKI